MHGFFTIGVLDYKSQQIESHNGARYWTTINFLFEITGLSISPSSLPTCFIENSGSDFSYSRHPDCYVTSVQRSSCSGPFVASVTRPYWCVRVSSCYPRRKGLRLKYRFLKARSFFLRMTVTGYPNATKALFLRCSSAESISMTWISPPGRVLFRWPWRLALHVRSLMPVIDGSYWLDHNFLRFGTLISLLATDVSFYTKRQMLLIIIND